MTQLPTLVIDFFKEINMHTVKKIVEIPGATHLFSEAGKMQQIAGQPWDGTQKSFDILISTK